MSWMSRLLQGWASTRGESAAPASAQAEADACLRGQIVPALEAVRAQLAEEGYETALEQDGDRVELRVMNYNGLPLKYSVRSHVYRKAVPNLASMRGEDSRERFARIEIEWGGRRRDYPPRRCSRDAIERAALRYYRRFLMPAPPGWYG